MVIDIKNARLKNCEETAKTSFVRVLVIDKFFVDNDGDTVWDNVEYAEWAIRHNSHWWKTIEDDVRFNLKFFEKEDTPENMEELLDKIWQNMINSGYIQIITYFTNSWQPKRTL